MRRWLIAAICAVACACASPRATGGEAARVVSPEVAALLARTAAAEPADVVRLIDAWHGDAHPLLTLARAQARWRLAQEAGDDERARLLAASADDHGAALALDPTLKEAHLGLAQIAAARDDWATACREAAAGIDPATADAARIGFLAGAALRAGDWRLATLAAQHGIMRFPDDAALRRVELAVLVNAGRAEDARQAVLALLERMPDDAQLWRHLAWSAHETGRADESLGALEAALTIASDDRTLRRQLAQAQLGAGLPRSALATVRPLIGDPASAEALADDALVLLASRAAEDAGEAEQARAWLAAVPEAQRSREQRLSAARLAVLAGDARTAGSALAALISGGERDPAVLTWAAALAESDGDAARAEALYLRASAAGGAASAAASLRLAAFYLKHDRRDEAAIVLASYLSEHPDDAQARALHARLQSAAAPVAR